jgi:hypothetical protein
MPTFPSTCSNNNLGVFKKTASGTTPYRIDFSKWLDSLVIPLGTTAAPDRITSQGVSVISSFGGVNIPQQSTDGRVVEFKASGGATGEICQCVVEVQTNNGNSDIFTFVIQIE